MLTERAVVLLDYATNADVLDPSSPLSHAQLIKSYIEGRWAAQAANVQFKERAHAPDNPKRATDVLAEAARRVPRHPDLFGHHRTGGTFLLSCCRAIQPVDMKLGKSRIAIIALRDAPVGI